MVFGDSTSDTGRRFAAPGSFDFDDIGVFPWEKLFEAPENNVSMIALFYTVHNTITAVVLAYFFCAVCCIIVLA